MRQSEPFSAEPGGGTASPTAMRHRLFQVLAVISLVLCRATGAGWLAQAGTHRALMLHLPGRPRVGTFLGLDQGAIVWLRQSVTPISEPFPPSASLSSSPVYGQGEPDLSHYRQLRDASGSVALTCVMNGALWRPTWGATLTDGWKFRGSTTRHVDAAGVGHLYLTG